MNSSGVGPIAPAVRLIKNVSKIFLEPSDKKADKAVQGTSADLGLKKSEGLTNVERKGIERFPSVESLLPVKILASPLLMRSEWAWKRMIATSLESFETKSVDANNQTQDMQVNPNYESAIKVLWSILTDISNVNSLDSWQTDLQNVYSKGPLVEFSQLNHGEVKHLPQIAKQWVVEDRLTSSVQVDSYERVGQGFFIPQNQTNKSNHVAYRYHARKQTRITGRGRLVHRIQFDIRVNEKPVRCTITSAKPSLLVHFDTNDLSLRKHLEIGQVSLTKVLKDAGWQLEQWSVSPFEDEKEVMK